MLLSCRGLFDYEVCLFENKVGLRIYEAGLFENEAPRQLLCCGMAGAGGLRQGEEGGLQ